MLPGKEKRRDGEDAGEQEPDPSVRSPPDTHAAAGATEDVPAAAAARPSWCTTTASGSYKGKREAIKASDLLAQIQREAQPGADNRTIGLIMPSTFHEPSGGKNWTGGTNWTDI